MNGNEDFNAGKESGLVLGELKLLHSEINEIKNAFDSFRNGIGERIEDYGIKITKLEEKVGAINWITMTVGWCLITGIVGALIKIMTK